MDTLRKIYLVALAVALLVLLVVRAPVTVWGWCGVVVTAVSMVGMGALATGVPELAGRFWLGWLAVQIVADVLAFVAETDAIWMQVGLSWRAAAAVGSGLVLLPLYLSLVRLGRGRPAPPPPGLA